MPEYKVILTDSEDKALRVVALDPQEWIDNVVHDRCRVAIEEIYAKEVDRMVKDPSITSIPANKDVVVLAEHIKTAAEIDAAERAKAEIHEEAN